MPIIGRSEAINKIKISVFGNTPLPGQPENIKINSDQLIDILGDMASLYQINYKSNENKELEDLLFKVFKNINQDPSPTSKKTYHNYKDEENPLNFLIFCQIKEFNKDQIKELSENQKKIYYDLEEKFSNLQDLFFIKINDILKGAEINEADITNIIENFLPKSIVDQIKKHPNYNEFNKIILDKFFKNFETHELNNLIKDNKFLAIRSKIMMLIIILVFYKDLKLSEDKLKEILSLLTAVGHIISNANLSDLKKGNLKSLINKIINIRQPSINLNYKNLSLLVRIISLSGLCLIKNFGPVSLIDYGDRKNFTEVIEAQKQFQNLKLGDITASTILNLSMINISPLELLKEVFKIKFNIGYEQFQNLLDEEIIRKIQNLTSQNFTEVVDKIAHKIIEKINALPGYSNVFTSKITNLSKKLSDEFNKTFKYNTKDQYIRSIDNQIRDHFEKVAKYTIYGGIPNALDLLHNLRDQGIISISKTLDTQSNNRSNKTDSASLDYIVEIKSQQANLQQGLKVFLDQQSIMNQLFFMLFLFNNSSLNLSFKNEKKPDFVLDLMILQIGNHHYNEQASVMNNILNENNKLLQHYENSIDSKSKQSSSNGNSGLAL